MGLAILAAHLVFFSLQLVGTTVLGSSVAGVVLHVLTPIISNHRASGVLRSLKQQYSCLVHHPSPDKNRSGHAHTLPQL